LRVAGNVAEARTFQIPTAGLPNARTLVPAVIADGVTWPTSTFCVLRKTRLHHPFWVHMTLGEALVPKHVAFAIDGQQPGALLRNASARSATVDVTVAEPMDRLEILKNGLPVYSAAFDRDLRLSTAGRDYQTIGFYWDAPSPQPGASGDFSGSVTLLQGRVLDAVQTQQAQDVKRGPNLVAWEHGSRRGLHNAVKIVFEGGEDTVFQVSMPGQNTTLNVTWRHIRDAGRVEFPLPPRARLLVRHLDQPTGPPRPLNETSFRATIPLSTVADRPLNDYVLRIVGPGARVYRSLPIQVDTTPLTDPTEARGWDAQRQTPITVPAAAAEVESGYWSFDAAVGRVEPDANGWGFDCELGGSYVRDGRFRPGNVPTRVPGKGAGGLHFDGDDVCRFPPQILPCGAWHIDMWIRPESHGTERQTLFYCGLPLHLYLEPDGSVGATYGNGNDIVRIGSRTLIGSGAWTRVTLSHDLASLRLCLNRSEEAAVPLPGPRSHIAYFSSLGAILPSAHTSSPRGGFAGLLDEVRIGAGAAPVDNR